ncbi:MAG: RNA-guided pseudouridylation complex pseudouridine synthase subunit Cbf5 [Candidatus Diapherotrites archaeon]|nr:RNA-guided pseudouridylation complex pseudouridine synthase subunit Cbf5 [Candidatus Diapherotrites archaeon]
MIVLRKEKAVKVAGENGGFLILDKPSGPSSHEVTAWVKKLYGEKCGHSGTLDPFATGVLVVAVGKAVKLLQALAKSDKEYVGVAEFSEKPDEKRISWAFAEFTGEIYQTPPKESAVKKVLRKRVIHSLELLEVQGRYALFRVACQHGTYVRTLVKDIGEVIGDKARLVELRRTRAGSFIEENALFLQDVADASNRLGVLQPMEALPLKKIVVGNKAVNAVCYGARLARAGLAALDEGVEEGEAVMLLTSGGQIIGLAEALMPTGEAVAAKKGFVAKPVRIVMGRDLFPKWK